MFECLSKTLNNVYIYTGSSKEPTSWAVVSEDLTEILVARGTELYRLTQDEHHTSTAVSKK